MGSGGRPRPLCVIPSHLAAEPRPWPRAEARGLCCLSTPGVCTGPPLGTPVSTSGLGAAWLEMAKLPVPLLPRNYVHPHLSLRVPFSFLCLSLSRIVRALAMAGGLCYPMATVFTGTADLSNVACSHLQGGLGEVGRVWSSLSAGYTAGFVGHRAFTPACPLYPGTVFFILQASPLPVFRAAAQPALPGPPYPHWGPHPPAVPGPLCGGCAMVPSCKWESPPGHRGGS